MRLIDAYALMDYTYNQKSRTIDCNDIARFPTAYSVDKVVYEIEAYGKNTYVCISKKNAIKIVKQGIVSDDVCEWEKGFSGYVGYPAYYSKCCTTNSKGLEMQTHIIADWKFCPYCGKKIKVVE